MLNRRRFVYTMAGSIAFGSGRWRSATAAGVSLEGPLTRDVFAALVRDTFSLLLDNRTAGLILLKLEDDDIYPDREQFTVVFQAPRELILLDGTYLISHIAAGTTQVFLQPAGHDDRYYYYYKAPFNLLRKGAGVQVPPPQRDRARQAPR